MRRVASLCCPVRKNLDRRWPRKPIESLHAFFYRGTCRSRKAGLRAPPMGIPCYFSLAVESVCTTRQSVVLEVAFLTEMLNSPSMSTFVILYFVRLIASVPLVGFTNAVRIITRAYCCKCATYLLTNRHHAISLAMPAQFARSECRHNTVLLLAVKTSA